MNSVTVTTSPSLALIKYWGKSSPEQNLPATSSLAVTLDGLETTTTVNHSSADRVFVNQIEADIERYTPFFNHFRRSANTRDRFEARSKANFPVSAGLASSSSGFAALALGCSHLTDPAIPLKSISEFARIGSASAARSLYGGFTVLQKESPYAEPLNIEWPDLRIVIAIVSNEQKSTSSRKAMEISRTTSPYYSKWLEESDLLFTKGLEALSNRDLKMLGPIIQRSYLSMFSTMLTSRPPTLYWLPQSVSLIHFCEHMRRQGIEVWETMDAGPQVKMICLEHKLSEILELLREKFPEIALIVSKPGGSPKL